jgi:hypothetical protein
MRLWQQPVMPRPPRSEPIVNGQNGLNGSVGRTVAKAVERAKTLPKRPSAIAAILLVGWQFLTDPDWVALIPHSRYTDAVKLLGLIFIFYRQLRLRKDPPEP